MKTTTFFIVLFSVLFICLPIVATAGDFAGGSGTEDDPYLVETAEHLDNVRNHLDAHFRQIDDIDLSGYAEGEGWDPIGYYYDRVDRESFEGTYDGNGYTIANLVIDRPDTDNIGLFGLLGIEGKLTDVALEEIEISGNKGVGGLVGWNDGDITSSYATGNVTGEGRFANVGGLVGFNSSDGTITGSYATGRVIGRNRIGGLVGLNSGTIIDGNATGKVSGEGEVGGLVGIHHGTIKSSYAMGDVAGEGNRVGGLVGWSTGTITGSYTTGNVTGSGRVGGLIGTSIGTITGSYAMGRVEGEESVGGLVGLNTGTITDSYATGNVIGVDERYEIVGGLVGSNPDGDVDYSYYDKETTGQSNSTDKGIPKTTEEMMQQDTFEGWDFEETWGIIENEIYPFLQWE